MLERLKNNKIPFGLLEKNEQEFFEKVGKKNCKFWRDSDDEWVDLKSTHTFYSDIVYRIKADYQERSFEIKWGDGDTAIKVSMNSSSGFVFTTITSNEIVINHRMAKELCDKLTKLLEDTEPE